MRSALLTTCASAQNSTSSFEDFLSRFAPRRFRQHTSVPAQAYTCVGIFRVCERVWYPCHVRDCNAHSGLVIVENRQRADQHEVNYNTNIYLRTAVLRARALRDLRPARFFEQLLIKC